MAQAEESREQLSVCRGRKQRELTGVMVVFRRASLIIIGKRERVARARFWKLALAGHINLEKAGAWDSFYASWLPQRQQNAASRLPCVV